MASAAGPSSSADNDAWTPGLLSLPESEQRRAALAVRATWPHIASRLADRANVAARVRATIAESEGGPDEVLVSMVLRHLERCVVHEDLRLHELAHLLAILVGPARATALSHKILSHLEEGMEETWYERKMRRQYSVGRA
jgi:hypothetical protein